MDLSETIRQLENQKQSLELAIANLKKLRDGGGSGLTANRRKSNRGRKSMGHEERQEVSKRMKKYWASRRETRDQNPL
jgi:hypothetical protein